MTITPKQTYKTLNPASTPAQVTQVGVAVEVGDYVIVGYYLNGALAAGTVSDSGGNTWYPIEKSGVTGIWAAGGDGLHIRGFFCKAAASGTISVTCNGTGIWAGIEVSVVAGLDPNPLTVLVDAALVGEGTSRTTHDSGNVVTTGGAYLFSFWGEVSGTYTYTENGQGFTIQQYELGVGLNDRVVTTGGTYHDSISTTANCYWASVLGAFREAPTAAGVFQTGVFQPGVFQGVGSQPAALVCSGSASTGFTATLTSSIRLVGSGTAVATGSATLSLPKPLAGTGAATTHAATPTLSTQVRLTAIGASTTAATAYLTSQIRLASSTVATAQGQGSLTTNIKLAGNGVAISTAGSPELLVGSSFGGTGLSVSYGIGVLSTQCRLVGGASAVASATGILSAQIRLLGAGASFPLSTSNLSTQVRVSSTASAFGVGSGALFTAIKLLAENSAQPSGQASLTTKINLVGSGVVTTSYSATLGGDTALAGSGMATSATLAYLTTTQFIAGTGTCQPTFTGILTTGIPLAGSTQSQTAGDGNLTTGIPLVGNHHSEPFSSASLSTSLQLNGAGNTEPGAIADLSTTIQLIGYAVGSSSGVGLIWTTTISSGVQIDLIGLAKLEVDLGIEFSAIELFTKNTQVFLVNDATEVVLDNPNNNPIL